MKLFPSLILSFGIAAPVGALEAIGEIRASLNDEELNWQVLREDDGSAMVQITDIGPLTMIDLHALGDGGVSIGVIFHDKPSGDTLPAGLTIDMRPDRGTMAGAVRESEEEPPRMQIDLLELEGEGRIRTDFSAVLCRRDTPDDCRNVEGRIDTSLGATS
ncbi:hypothetical protein SAMN05444398_12144 [Roseovarius pacificus]|uniref:Uncharacterized protein n=1 Tax=Roseovarius pacificus TaxID=337701 RepID=A0A1M7JP87_9RHOB|nr:hypothetical protein [Roseovarius pacificus]GGO58483.1 hypothetical protein GCM10011315_28160 [Roseovarius pacificus]SHM54919.1 hypothetical protein SAMN05444398_12144 [Roseovarius pacificus]